MKKINVGIIGVGQIGKMHIKLYKSIGDVNIIAIADINKKEAEKVSSEFGIPHIYTDFKKLLKRDDIIAVDVCLHNNFHMPVSVAALNAGKNVFCEKPMAGTYFDSKKMFDAAVKNKCMLSIQIHSLFSSETKAAKKIIEKGHLGHIYHARTNSGRRRGRPYVDGYGSPAFVQKKNSGGGALLDHGVYYIGNILHLIGNPEVERITGRVYQETEMDTKRKKISGYDVEEFAVGFVRFKNGMTLDILNSWASHMEQSGNSCIYGNKAGIKLQPLEYFYNIEDMLANARINTEDADMRWHDLQDDADAYDSPQHHWVAALQKRVKLLPTDAIALNTMLIQEGIYISDKLGREVTAEDVKKLSRSTAVKL